MKILGAKDLTGVEESIEREEIEKFTKNIKNIEFILSIDKKSSLISEAALNFDFEMDNFANSLTSPQNVTLAPVSKIAANLKLSTKFSDYNKPVIVEIPKDAKDLTQYLEEFEKELGIEGENFQLPEEFQQPQEPQSDDSLRDLLDNQSPVLGKKSFWDLILLGEIL